MIVRVLTFVPLLLKQTVCMVNNGGKEMFCDLMLWQNTRGTSQGKCISSYVSYKYLKSIAKNVTGKRTHSDHLQVVAQVPSRAHFCSYKGLTKRFTFPVSWHYFPEVFIKKPMAAREITQWMKHCKNDFRTKKKKKSGRVEREISDEIKTWEFVSWLIPSGSH